MRLLAVLIKRVDFVDRESELIEIVEVSADRGRLSIFPFGLEIVLPESA
jgi:hypothetical protein